MADPLVCPACDVVTPVSDPPHLPHTCPWCGHQFDHPPRPVEPPDRPPPIPVRRREKPATDPGPTPRAERDGTWGGIRWAINLGGLLVVVSCCCAGLALDRLQELFGTLTGPRWREHRSAAGGFRVELPAAPRADIAELTGAKLLPGDRIEGTVLVRDGERYTVLYSQLPPPGQRAADDAFLRSAIANVLDKLPANRQVWERAIQVSGYPGREVAVEVAREFVLVVRVVVTDSRFYSLWVSGRPETDRNNSRFTRFLDSFAVTPP